MFDLQPVGPCTLYHDHIKAADSVHPMPLGQILGRELDQFRPFALVDCQKGAAKSPGGAGFHFHKDEDTRVFRHQIEFTQCRPEIAIEDAISFVAQ